MKAPKPPTIRPGQRHPFRKGTQEEIDSRIAFVGRMLVAGARKSEIHQFVRDQFKIGWRQCDRYVSEFLWLARACAEVRQTAIAAKPKKLESLHFQQNSTANTGAKML
jgi:hypothetical protein